MKKALLYKDLKKTKLAWLIVFLLGTAHLTYLFVKTGHSFRIVGVEHLWDVIVNRDQFIFRNLKYFPMFAGVCIALAQYIPEAIQKRIKLTLHLPLKERTIVLLMLGYGILALVLLFTLHIGGVLIYTTIYFSVEFVSNTLITVFPWYLAGITAYLFIAMVCIEPTWKRRIYNLLVAAGSIQLFFVSNFPGAYSKIMFLLILFAIYVLPFTFLSVARFKNGEQK